MAKLKEIIDESKKVTVQALVPVRIARRVGGAARRDKKIFSEWLGEFIEDAMEVLVV